MVITWAIRSLQLFWFFQSEVPCPTAKLQTSPTVPTRRRRYSCFHQFLLCDNKDSKLDVDAQRLCLQFSRSSHQGFSSSVVFECSRVRGTTRILLLLMARQRGCGALVCLRGKWCRFISSMVASQTGAKLQVYCLVLLILLLHILLRAKSQVRSFYSKYLGLSSILCGCCFLPIIWFWIIVLKLRLHQTCMGYYLCLWYVLSLVCFRSVPLAS